LRTVPDNPAAPNTWSLFFQLWTRLAVLPGLGDVPSRSASSGTARWVFLFQLWHVHINDSCVDSLYNLGSFYSHLEDRKGQVVNHFVRIGGLRMEIQSMVTVHQVLIQETMRYNDLE